MEATQDTEITLGTGKLLGIFFLVVVICAVFFTMGYLLGRGSAPTSPSTTIVNAVPNGNTASKPSAGGSKAADAQNCPAGSSNCPSTGNGPGSSFYSTVTSNDPAAGQSPAASAPSKAPEANSNSAPELKDAANGSYAVQVAAVSRQEDADILVNALRKKQYPVYVVANVPGDSFFHVQVGPFSDSKEAEAMRSRLAGDGYNAIVKK
ncbi:MAG TPA: SPOR domain-containing protein [Candidatus Angelobacter sp.]|jgi:cell division septation protein DedD|nr:SPOR domain-containing protein [Candidatus Angelobacter sp.]